MTNNKSRRSFLRSSGLILGALARQVLVSADIRANEQSAVSAYSLPIHSGSPADIATDENYWNQIRSFDTVTDQVTNLENGYWGIMSSPVMSAYQANTAFINLNNTHYARQEWWEHYVWLHQQVADFLNLDPEEVVLTRGATEALQALITGYNLLKPGDKVLYADLDYSEMKHAMRWLEERRGVKVIKKDRIKNVVSYLLKTPESDNIMDRIDTGTANFAAYMTIPKAIEFHKQIGTKVKQARLKYLRDLWVNETRGLANIQILTPDDDHMVAALTSFQLKGQTKPGLINEP